MSTRNAFKSISELQLRKPLLNEIDRLLLISDFTNINRRNVHGSRKWILFASLAAIVSITLWSISLRNNDKPKVITSTSSQSITRLPDVTAKERTPDKASAITEYKKQPTYIADSSFSIISGPSHKELPITIRNTWLADVKNIVQHSSLAITYLIPTEAQLRALNIEVSPNGISYLSQAVVKEPLNWLQKFAAQLKGIDVNKSITTKTTIHELGIETEATSLECTNSISPVVGTCFYKHLPVAFAWNSEGNLYAEKLQSTLRKITGDSLNAFWLSSEEDLPLTPVKVSYQKDQNRIDAILWYESQSLDSLLRNCQDYSQTATIKDLHHELVVQNALRNIQLVPNPARHFFTLNITTEESRMLSAAIYDVQGSKLAESLESAPLSGIHSFTFDTGALPAGVYFVQILSNKKEIVTRELIVSR